MDPNKEFYQSVQHLVELLKKMIPHIPPPPYKESASWNSKDMNLNLNFCFFNFLPMSPEEMDELEEIYEEFLLAQEERAGVLKGELTVSDLEFLRRHGIRF